METNLLKKVAVGTAVMAAASFFTGVNAQDYIYDQADTMVIEAEHYYELVTGSGDTYDGAVWSVATEFSDYTGDGYMIAPDVAGIGDVDDAILVAPGVTYKVNITEPGSYYWFARCSFSDDESDSYHLGAADTVILGSMMPAKEGISNDEWGYNYQNSSGIQPELEFTTAGVHEFTVIMREGNFRLDQIILATTAEAYDPDSDDPTETSYTTDTEDSDSTNQDSTTAVSQILSSSVSMNVYPNPVQSTATISFDVQNQGNVNVSVFNAQGQLVKVLINESMSAGNKQVTWDATGDVSTGFYFVKIENAGAASVSKIVVQ